MLLYQAFLTLYALVLGGGGESAGSSLKHTCTLSSNISLKDVFFAPEGGGQHARVVRVPDL